MKETFKKEDRKKRRRMRFCPVCDNFLYINTVEGKEDASKKSNVQLKCRSCGYSVSLEPKTIEEGLVLETVFNSGSSASGAASGVTINEYTLADPTLPHVKTLVCPNTSCETRTDKEKSDVIYIKKDPTRLEFQYICTVCKTNWSS